MSFYTEPDITIPIVVAIIDEKNFPWIVVCTRMWEPSYVLRRGEQQIIVRTHFDKAKDQCWEENGCLNSSCPFNKTDRSFNERLSKSEQEFLEKHRFEITDQVREAYAKSPKECQIVYIELKERPPGV
jgi:hypothetical protein